MKKIVELSRQTLSSDTAPIKSIQNFFSIGLWNMSRLYGTTIKILYFRRRRKLYNPDEWKSSYCLFVTRYVRCWTLFMCFQEPTQNILVVQIISNTFAETSTERKLEKTMKIAKSSKLSNRSFSTSNYAASFLTLPRASHRRKVNSSRAELLCWLFAWHMAFSRFPIH
jgi:hypothetical protein